MAIVGIFANGTATIVETVKTAEGAYCVAADDRGNAYVSDPNNGRMLIIKDTVPPSSQQRVEDGILVKPRCAA